jgi:hypothetical protein
MIQPIANATSAATSATASGPDTVAGGKSFEQVLLQEVGKIAGSAAGGFLGGGPAGAAVCGALTLLQSR